MARILKFKPGGVSKKQERAAKQEELNTWKQQVADYISNPESDQDKVNHITTYSQNLNNYLVSTNQKPEDYEHAAYKIMTDFINGTPVNLTSIGTSPYEKAALIWSKTTKNNNRDQESDVEYDPITRHYHTYDWTGGKQLDSLPISFTEKDKIREVLQALKSGLSDAAAAQSKNLPVYGIEDSALSAATSKIAQIDNLLGKLNTQSDDLNFNEFYRLLNDRSFGVDWSTIKTLLPQRFQQPTLTAAQQTDRTLRDNGYLPYTHSNQTVADYIKSKNWNLYNSPTGVTVLDGDYNQIKNRYKIFDDPTSTEFGKGLFIDDSGTLHFGDLYGQNALDPQDIGTIYNTALSNYKLPYSTYDYNRTSQYNTFLDELYDRVNDPRARELLSNPDLLLGDISHLYAGDYPVLGIASKSDLGPTGINWNGHKVLVMNPDGSVEMQDFDPTQFYMNDVEAYSNDNQLKSKIGNISDFSTFNLNDAVQAEEFLSKNADGVIEFKNKNNEITKLPLNDLNTVAQIILSNYHENDKISVNFYKLFGSRQAALASVVMWLNQGLLPDLPSKYRVYLENLLQQGGAYTPRDTRNAAQLAMHNAAFYNKEGGVLKAFRGTELPSSQETANRNASVQKAQESGRTEEAQLRGDSNFVENFSAADGVRAGALVADILAMLASFVPVYGTATSGILSGGSSVADLIADFMDPAVSTESAVKRLVGNIGLTVVGLIPGGKSANIARRALNLIPRAIPVVFGIKQAVSPEFQDAWDQLNSDWKNLTVDQWIVLGDFLKTFAGVGRSATATRNALKLRVRTQGPSDKVSVRTKAGGSKEMSIEQAKQIHAAGQKGGNKAAQEKYKQLFPDGEELAMDYGADANRGTLRQKMFRADEPLNQQPIPKTMNANDAAFVDYMNKNRTAYQVKPNEEHTALTGKSRWVPNISWLKTDYEIVNSDGYLTSPFTKGFNLDIPIGRRAWNLQPPPPPSNKNGGKLIKLEEYLKAKSNA